MKFVEEKPKIIKEEILFGEDFKMSTLPIMFPRLDKLVAEKLHILISWHCAKQRRVKSESPNK